MKAAKAVKVAIAALALTSASAAFAENLVYYSEDVEGRFYFYDSDTIRRVSGGYINVWTLQDASRDRTVRWRTNRVLFQIDCDGMRSAGVSFAQYDANNRLLDSGSTPYPTMQPAIPGTTGYSLVEAICAR